jgi:hypothetical protein
MNISFKIYTLIKYIPYVHEKQSIEICENLYSNRKNELKALKLLDNEYTNIEIKKGSLLIAFFLLNKCKTLLYITQIYIAIFFPEFMKILNSNNNENIKENMILDLIDKM